MADTPTHNHPQTTPNTHQPNTHPHHQPETPEITMTKNKTPESESPENPAEAVASESGEMNDISLSSGESGNDKSVQVLVRVAESTRERWREVSGSVGVSMSEFVREAVDERVRVLTECLHPLQFRQSYAWQETCLKCGLRLRDGDEHVQVSTRDVLR